MKQVQDLRAGRKVEVNNQPPRAYYLSSIKDDVLSLSIHDSDIT